MKNKFIALVFAGIVMASCNTNKKNDAADADSNRLYQSGSETDSNKNNSEHSLDTTGLDTSKVLPDSTNRIN